MSGSEDRSHSREAAFRAMDEAYDPGFARYWRRHGDDDVVVGTMVDQVYGGTWLRDGLALRDRRLLILAVAVSFGLEDVVELQLEGALSKGDLSEDELREIAVFLALYTGWPKAIRFNDRLDRVLRRRAEGADEQTSARTSTRPEDGDT